MWNYEKRLQYPISISTPNAKMASFIISQYGGPDGEMGASMRYLAQRFSFANPRIAGVLTDIGTEELYHPSWILKNESGKPFGLPAFFPFPWLCYLPMLLCFCDAISTDHILQSNLYVLLQLRFFQCRKPK